jgi:hypothetical protein
VSPPFISGDIVALILDTPFADLVVDNYVNTSVPHSIEKVPVTRGRDISDMFVFCKSISCFLSQILNS